MGNETTFKTMALADLASAPYNPRQISAKALDGLEASLRRFGLVQPVIWNKRTGHIVGGHQRVKALAAMGKAEAQVVVVDLDEAEEKALNVALNNPHIAGEFTEDLQELLAGIKLDTEDLFAELRLDELFVEPIGTGETDENEVPEAPENPVTVTGDVWILGRHRVCCGDSTNADDVAKAIGVGQPGLMVTDPPYGVEYDPNWRNEAQRVVETKGGRRLCAIGATAVGKVENDDQADWREAWALFSGDVGYVWHAGIKAGEVFDSLVACDFEIRSQIVWAKNRLNISRCHYHPHHEPLFYCVRKGKSATWTGDRKQSTLWQIDVEKCDTGHGTQKPVECMRRPMSNHGHAEVYDPFLGSGTSIIAAETLGRACYGLELSEKYVDVIVNRWQDFTGETAVLESTGQTFAQVREERHGGA